MVSFTVYFTMCVCKLLTKEKVLRQVTNLCVCVCVRACVRACVTESREDFTTCLALVSFHTCHILRFVCILVWVCSLMSRENA